jgi:hypothetical protein
VVREPVEHLGVGQLAPGGLAVEVGSLRPGEPDDVLLPRQQVIQLPGLAGEELLVVGVQDQQRRGDLPSHIPDLVLPYLGEQVERVGHALRLAAERQPPGCLRVSAGLCLGHGGVERVLLARVQQVQRRLGQVHGPDGCAPYTFQAGAPRPFRPNDRTNPNTPGRPIVPRHGGLAARSDPLCRGLRGRSRLPATGAASRGCQRLQPAHDVVPIPVAGGLVS